MVENLSMPDLLKDVILIYYFCRAQQLFFSGIAIFTAEHTEIFIYLQIIILSMKSILNCPKSHKFSLFNVGDTRIQEGK